MPTERVTNLSMHLNIEIDSSILNIFIYIHQKQKVSHNDILYALFSFIYYLFIVTFFFIVGDGSSQENFSISTYNEYIYI